MIEGFVIIYWLGLAAIICWAIYGVVKYSKTHQISDLAEKIIIGLLVVAMFFCGMLVVGYKNAIVEEAKNKQFDRCLNAQRSDGEYLTQSQCEYFRDVFEGKYTHIDGGDYDPLDAMDSRY